jgi:hypothetical protein
LHVADVFGLFEHGDGGGSAQIVWNNLAGDSVVEANVAEEYAEAVCAC